MTTSNRRALKARYVLPTAGEPLAEGIVTIEGSRIVGVGRTAMAGDIEDLGNVAILPGLVNAHTHLEFSSLGEPLGSAGQPFPDWVRAVLAWRPKNPVCQEDAVRSGLRACSRLGTTTLGEIAQPDWPQSLVQEAPLGTTVFAELIGPTEARAAASATLAAAHLERSDADRWFPALSPHAPYTVRPELLEVAISLSRFRRVPLAFHLAESREELELLAHRRGPFLEMLRSLPSWDLAVLAGRNRPLDYLRQLARAHRVLVIHGNYLADDEIQLLAEHRAAMSVVYCPRTHRYFRHAPYPLDRMMAAGVRVCLGTDSLATSPDLSLLEEMRELARLHPATPASRVLEMGTLEGARALGRAREVGTLEAGKFADLAVVALPDRDGDPYALLLDSTEPVVATWFRGEPAWSSGS